MTAETEAVTGAQDQADLEALARRAAFLREQLGYHNYCYSVLSAPIIADADAPRTPCNSG